MTFPIFKLELELSAFSKDNILKSDDDLYTFKGTLNVFDWVECAQVPPVMCRLGEVVLCILPDD